MVNCQGSAAGPEPGPETDEPVQREEVFLLLSPPGACLEVGFERLSPLVTPPPPILHMYLHMHTYQLLQ